MTEPTTTIVDMLRHGEPVGGKRYRGQVDDPLSERGWKQMRKAVGKRRPADVIVTSPLTRCRAFAEEVVRAHDLPLEVDGRFMEVGFGEWEGRTAKELMDADPEVLMRFWSDPIANTPPGAEPLTEFRDRVVAAWDDLLARHAGRQVLVVGHAGSMRMVIRHVLEMPLANVFRLQVGYAATARLRVDTQDGISHPRLAFLDAGK